MGRILTREEWRKRRRRKRIALIALVLTLFFLIIVFGVMLIIEAVRNRENVEGMFGGQQNSFQGTGKEGEEALEQTLSNGVEIQEDYLTPNEYSRPQTPLKEINAVVIHYTANPGTTAANNRNYFEGLASRRTTSASSHYIIGLKGEVIQCIPLNEIAFASNDRNADTVSVECCHEDETGKFNEATYQSMVSLTAALCVEFDLKEEDIIRHYDVTGKLCPLYFVENEEAWLQFRKEVMDEADKIKEERK